MISQAQIEIANNTDIVAFLRSKGRGEEIRQDGKEYRWKGHQGLIISGNKWYQHGNGGTGGGPIQFVENFFEAATFPEAVEMLTGGGMPNLSPVTSQEPKPFHLPAKAANNDHAIHYLTEKRKIAPEVISAFIERGDIYEEEGYHHNIVFVGRDSNGTPRNASRKGITEKQFRRDVSGSKKEFGFGTIGNDDRLLAFEAPIDLLSFLTMYPAAKNASLISCGGTSGKAVMQFISDHPNIKEIYLCLDNDEAGNAGTAKMIRSIPAKFKVWHLIPSLKDWNEVLTDEAANRKYGIEVRQ